MDNTGYNLNTVVIAEAEKLNVATDASLIRYITALAEQGIEEEIDNLWVMGKRPEGTYRERFTREVIIALKEHIGVVRQLEAAKEICGECKQGYDEFGCLGCSHEENCGCMECDSEVAV